VGQALEVCCLADLLLAIPGTRLRPSLAVHALSSEVDIWIRDATGRHAEPFATDLRLSLPQPARPDATHPRRRRFSRDIFGDKRVARVSNGTTPAVDAFLRHKRGVER
jgi:hypothetical protein